VHAACCALASYMGSVSLSSFKTRLERSPSSFLLLFYSLSDKSKRLFAELAQLCDPADNCATYRQKFRQLARPGLPLLDLVLSDLTFIDQSEADYVDPPRCEIINFRKMRLMGNVLSSLQSFQRVSYRLKELPVVQEFLAKGVLIADEQTLLKLSLQCEPPQQSP
jgi:hypothetical protein